MSFLIAALLINLPFNGVLALDQPSSTFDLNAAKNRLVLYQSYKSLGRLERHLRGDKAKLDVTTSVDTFRSVWSHQIRYRGIPSSKSPCEERYYRVGSTDIGYRQRYAFSAASGLYFRYIKSKVWFFDRPKAFDALVCVFGSAPSKYSRSYGRPHSNETESEPDPAYPDRIVGGLSGLGGSVRSFPLSAQIGLAIFSSWAAIGSFALGFVRVIERNANPLKGPGYLLLGIVFFAVATIWAW